MFAHVARALFGSANDRALKEYSQRVPQINAYEPELRELTDAQLQGRTEVFKKRLAEGESLKDIQCEAFAVCREASRRVLGMRHFDVQLIGGMVLHDGRIAEMRTGEGKTLVATLAVYLNALEGKGVHVVTVNDYLASRDVEEMGKLYNFLGLSVGVIVADISDEDRKAAYNADITYGTNNEFGFDYLRDNMKFSLEEMVQRPFNFAIVDEVDSILIDEARTPLIISGPAEDGSELYIKVDQVVRKLVEDPSHYEKDEKLRTVTLTDKGTEYAEDLMREDGILTHGTLYDPSNLILVHHLQQALRAHTLFARDVDYLVKGGKLILIDEFTGRMMDGRRYSEGLHQALEAKEGVQIQRENQTLASVTFQNYFRLYPKLSGMTGTAMTEADEFMEIYNLRVIEIPTNLPVQRKDGEDEVYLTETEKFDAVADLIAEVSKTGQPILVGTTSIEKSEQLSENLKKRRIKHDVLNARHHEKEAHIVAQAGAPGSITIATNMAGRGTDIKLGGNYDMMLKERIEEFEAKKEREATEKERSEIAAEVKAEVEKNQKLVQEAGGLFVIGTERHESRRIDNQLRGRSGRQGDPGRSRFFLSLEDDLIRIFGAGRMGSVMQKAGLKPGEAITHPWLSKALEQAQKKVEARNFDMRKNTLKYDDVMNDQRREVYAQRREYMNSSDLSGLVADMREGVLEDLVSEFIPEKSYVEMWDLEGLHHELLRLFSVDIPLDEIANEEGADEARVLQYLREKTDEAYTKVREEIGEEMMKLIEKHVVMSELDGVWKEHLHNLDHLRQGIGLRAYGQKDPLNEYKQEAFSLFQGMLFELRQRVVSSLSHVRPAPPEMEADMTINVSSQDAEALASQPVDSETLKEWKESTPRNSLCPCGSGKKFKHCHGSHA